MGKPKVKKVSAVFLDRDGIINVPNIINRKPVAISSVKQLCFTDGIVELIDRFHYLKYKIFVVTNQPDIAKGIISFNEAININKKILDKLPKIEYIYMCVHNDDDNCDCRKPKAGMLFDAKEKYGIDLQSSWMIGDRWRDVNCGFNAKCKTIFVDYGYNENLKIMPDYVVKNIKEIKEII